MGCACRHDFNGHSGAGKLHRDVVRMGHINAETDCWAILPVLQPVFHDVANQLGFTHNLTELTFLVVAPIPSNVRRFHSREIGV